MLGGTGSEPHSDEDRSACRGASQGGGTARAGPSAHREGTCRYGERQPSRPAGRHPPRAGASGGLGGRVVSGEAGSSAADRAAAVGLEGAGARARLDVSLSYTLRTPACHAACQAPWHPEDGRCAVPRAGPEDWARWALWGRASATAGWMSWGSPCAQGVSAMLTARSAAPVCLRARGLTDCGAGGVGCAGDGDSRIYAYIASACSFCAVG